MDQHGEAAYFDQLGAYMDPYKKGFNGPLSERIHHTDTTILQGLLREESIG
jgi:hypothetical protein